MAQDEPAKGQSRDAPKGTSPGCMTHFLIYAVAAGAMYFAGTPEITGNFSAAQERDFHIAAVRTAPSAGDGRFVALTLAALNAEKIDAASLTFLLPDGADRVNIPGGDIHEVIVLERHPDWQLLEYRFGNTHDSVSRYRAFGNRVEPVSYRMTMSMGLFFSAIVLLVPSLILSSLVNVIWRRVSLRRKAAHGA